MNPIIHIYIYIHYRGFFPSSLCRCVELIICEQMTKYKVRLKDISTLEFAENKAKSKLSIIRRSMVRSDKMFHIVKMFANNQLFLEAPFLLHFVYSDQKSALKAIHFISICHHPKSSSHHLFVCRLLFWNEG